MKRLLVSGLMFNVALLIVGLTWIAPVEARQDRTGGVSVASSASPTVATSTSAAAGGQLTVALDQWSIVPQASDVIAGPVTFTVSNNGTITHEFVVMRTDTPAANFQVGTYQGEKDRVNEGTAGTNVGETGDLTAGATKAVTIDLKPGHYVFMCNLPGHYGLGMHTDFTVI